MKLGIDVDDVVAQCAAPYLRAFAAEFGVDLGDAELGWHLLDNFADVPKERKDDFRQRLYGGTFFAELECYPDCVGAVARLREAGHELHFITARSERRRKITEDWLDRQGLLKSAFGVHLRPTGEFVPRAYDADSSAEFKAQTARMLGLGAFCEDDPVVAARLAEAEIQVYLFDRAWNAELSHPLVRRVRDWDEVVRALVPSA